MLLFFLRCIPTETHLSSYDLPGDVFEPGETRPIRPKKRVIKKVDGAAKKRSFDASELEVHSPPMQVLLMCYVVANH